MNVYLAVIGYSVMYIQQTKYVTNIIKTIHYSNVLLGKLSLMT